MRIPGRLSKYSSWVVPGTRVGEAKSKRAKATAPCTHQDVEAHPAEGDEDNHGQHAQPVVRGGQLHDLGGGVGVLRHQQGAQAQAQTRSHATLLLLIHVAQLVLEGALRVGGRHVELKNGSCKLRQ